MSTRATIIYLSDRNIHLFEEVGDTSSHIYLECIPSEVELRSVRSATGVATVEVVLCLDGADLDALVDAYVAERAKRRQQVEEMRASWSACPGHHFQSSWLPTLGRFCALCGMKEGV